MEYTEILAKKISSTVEREYINEHLSYMETAIKEMRKKLNNDEASRFIEAFTSLQWHERSVIVGSRKMLKQLKITEKDVGVVNILSYKED